MLYGGYGFHKLWGNIVEYIEEVDIEEIKSELANYNNCGLPGITGNEYE